MASEKTSPANIFAVLGFALLLIVAIWSAIQVVKYAPRLFGGSTLSFSSKPVLDISVDKLTYDSEEEITVKWSANKPLSNGTLSFVYACKEGLVFDIFDTTSNSYKVLPCNAPYNMPLTATELKIKSQPVSKNTDTTLAIVYTNTNADKIKDVVNITIKGKSITQTPPTTPTNPQTPTVPDTPTTPNTPTPAQPNDACKSKIYGTPDLLISGLQLGSLAPNGYFAEKSSFAKNERLAIRFYVSNKGTKTSPAWFFNIVSQMSSYPIYTSTTQPEIPPCSGRIYTITIDNPNFISTGNAFMEINVDPQNLIRELNESNNSAVKTFSVY